MVGFHPIASGSKGNCVYLETPHTKILIDAGVSARRIAKFLETLGHELEEIDAILITHEHMDHVAGLKTLTANYGIPVFANADTAKGITSALGIRPKFKIFTTHESFAFKDLEIHPFSVSHDTLDPVAFLIRTGGLKLGFCTDLGHISSLIIKKLEGCDYLYVEANHQPSMVYASNRPLIYKQRVLGRQGHLSNEVTAELLTAVFHEGLKHVHLAHLSSECNHPDLAVKIVQEALEKRLMRTELSIAYQDQASRAILF